MVLRAVLAGLLLLPMVGCTNNQNKNKSVEEAVEDAGHETGQAMERAGDSIRDATN